MKKTYVKPMMGFESFELSTNIAGTCGNSVGHAEGQCTVFPGFDKLFVGEFCDQKIDNDGDKWCYHNPSDSERIFAS